MHPSDHPIITERYFFPRDEGPSNPLRVKVEGAELCCSFTDMGHKRTMLFFHGNGEVASDYLPSFPERLSEMRLNTFLSEYRGYGGSTGTPQLGTMLDDVDAIIDAAGGPDNLIVFGRSIGSIYAIEAVRRFPQISGLIIESGIANVLERIILRASPSELGVSEEELRAAFQDKFDHASKLASYLGPVLILHAQGDHLVSVQHARENAKAAGDDCKLVILPRGDHNSIYFENQKAYLQQVSDFVAACGR